MTPLRIAMTGNAVFSSVSAVSLWLFQPVISMHTNIGSVAISLIAVGLAGFAGLLAYGVLSARTRVIGRLAVLLDWAWVCGSLIAIVLPMSHRGRIGIVVVATMVAIFALWQQRGLSTSRSR
jgi:hypothetical protein